MVIGGYQWVLMTIILAVIGGYQWVLMTIILVVIGGYQWLLMNFFHQAYFVPLMAIGGYFINGY